MSGHVAVWLWPAIAVALISAFAGSRTRTKLIVSSPVAGLLAALVVVALQIHHNPVSVCFEAARACTLRDSAAGYHLFFLGVTYAFAIELGTGLGAIGRRTLDWTRRHTT